MVALVWALAYVAIDFSLARIGRVQSGELLRAAALAEGQGEVTAAIVAYRKASQYARNPTNAFLALVNLERRTGQLDEALEHARAALRTATRDQELPARLTLAKVRAERAEWAEARLAYEEATSIRSDCAEAQYGLAWSAWEENDFERMGRALDQLRGADERDSSAEFIESRTAVRARQAAATQRIADEGESGATLYSLAMCQRELGEWTKCGELLARSASFSDAPADAWYWLGIAAEMENDTNQAIEHYAETVKRLPSHVRAAGRLDQLQ